MTKKALLVGINYFGTGAELSGCHNDVDNVAAALESVFEYESENIILLKDSSDDPAHLKSRSPTRNNIISWINKIRDSLEDGDSFFLHYSGHGYHVADSKRDRDWEQDGRDEVICPVDNAVISDDEMHYLLVDKLPEGVRLRALFDCCHSGTMLDLSYRWKYDDNHHFENACSTCASAQREYPEKKGKDVLMLSGCLDKQTSADAWIGVVPDFKGLYAGAMTWSFLASLREATGTKGFEFLKNITWKDLIYNMRFKLQTGGYEQIPQLCAFDKPLVKAPVDL